MQKIIFLVLIALISLFQYQLWWSKSGIYQIIHLKQRLQQQILLNQNLVKRNNEIRAEIESLKGSDQILEARARHELNLIKPDEKLIFLTESAQ